MAEDVIAVRFVNSRNKVDITYDNYSGDFRRLQEFIWRPESAVRPSPATLQLALVSNGGNQEFIDALYGPVSAPSIAKLDDLIKQAADLLGERVASGRGSDYGNLLQRYFPRTYLIFEAYAVLSVKCLEPNVPITHYACNLVADRFQRDAADVGKHLSDVERMMTKPPLSNPLVEYKQHLVEALDVAKELVTLALQSKRSFTISDSPSTTPIQSPVVKLETNRPRYSPKSPATSGATASDDEQGPFRSTPIAETDYGVAEV